MKESIVFVNESGGVSIMTPCSTDLTTLEVGAKDVPVGVDFWVISADDLPEDRSFRNAWELDVEAMGKPHGVGGTYVPKENDQ